jgi:hypothetical protein
MAQTAREKGRAGSGAGSGAGRFGVEPVKNKEMFGLGVFTATEFLLIKIFSLNFFFFVGWGLNSRLYACFLLKFLIFKISFLRTGRGGT